MGINHFFFFAFHCFLKYKKCKKIVSNLVLKHWLPGAVPSNISFSASSSSIIEPVN